MTTLDSLLASFSFCALNEFQPIILFKILANHRLMHSERYLRVVQTRPIFEIDVGKSWIRHSTTLKLDDEFLD